MNKTIDGTCPACGHKLDAETVVQGSDESAPRPGDLGVCYFCTAFLIFGADLTRRLLNQDDQVPPEDMELMVVARERIARSRDVYKGLLS